MHERLSGAIEYFQTPAPAGETLSSDFRSLFYTDYMMSTASLHILVGWGAMLCGVISGAGIGLFFHQEEWAGGYGAFRRRMLRLAHVSFFGLGFINLLFGLTLETITLPAVHSSISSCGFLVGVTTMPLCCYLAAWKMPFRHLFPVPVLGVLAGVVSILLGWPSS